MFFSWFGVDNDKAKNGCKNSTEFVNNVTYLDDAYFNIYQKYSK